MDLIDKRNIYDYVLTLDKLTKVQKARILNLTLIGVYSNIQMYFVARLFELITQAEMENIIVLFHKFQRNMADTFNTRARDFIKANLGDDNYELTPRKEIEGETKE